MKVLMIALMTLFLSSCASAPPSLFEVEEMCDKGKVEHYKVRTKEQSVSFECKT